MAKHVVRRGRFLNPQRFETGEGSGPFDRLDHIPALIGVDYERAAGADFLPRDGAPANIVRPVGAHLEFKMRESVGRGFAAEPANFSSE